LFSFTQSFQKFNSLQQISLVFSKNSNEITDNALNDLSQGLQKLSSLQALSLRFPKCEKITDAGLGHLKIGLQALTSLKHLDLFLNEYDQNYSLLNMNWIDFTT